MRYEFEYIWNEIKNIFGVRLQDKTEVIIYSMKGSKGLMIRYPKRKFKRIFQKQIDDKKSKFISVEFSITEMKAISKGLEKAHKEHNKAQRKHNKAQRNTKRK